MALELLYLCNQINYRPFLKNIFLDYQHFFAAKYYKGKQGAGYIWIIDLTQFLNYDFFYVKYYI